MNTKPKTMNHIKVLDRIRTIRELKGYSQEYMASNLGISQNNYSLMELGKSRLTTERLCKISEILELSLADLLSENLIINISQSNQTNIKPRKPVYVEKGDENFHMLQKQLELLRQEIDSIKSKIA